MDEYVLKSAVWAVIVPVPVRKIIQTAVGDRIDTLYSTKYTLIPRSTKYDIPS